MLLLKSFLFVCLTSVLVRTNESSERVPEDGGTTHFLSVLAGGHPVGPPTSKACLPSLQIDDGFDLNDALKDDPTEPWDDNDGFDLSDALEDHSTKASHDNDGFDLNDALEDQSTKAPRNDDGFDLSDVFKDDPIKPADDNDGFDLNDALEDHSTKAPSGGFSDSDLEDVVNSDYKPEKTKSKAIKIDSMIIITCCLWEFDVCNLTATFPTLP
ncbi:CD99 antigen-like protein 2 isoform X2 [Carcharodon carcharias]|uniref:CD99 antigen-like protein 2 isoform X2 n=1 Tax=Carcharodon carcharias TaxID=13397 RepID=UPI001B7E53C6|nr:CD99 antigen-like protein 2 isoform X2 [Carcharodon carcharias]